MGGLFKGPALPKVKPTPPLPDETMLKKARRRELSAQTKTQGAQSTLLSTGGREKLGA